MKRLLPLLVITVCSSAWALNFNFLNNSPVELFTSADREMQNQAADKALDSTANGKKIIWENPKTGNGGYFQPLNTVKKNNTTCRNLKIFNQDYKNRTDQYVFLFCKYSDGWKMPGGQ